MAHADVTEPGDVLRRLRSAGVELVLRDEGLRYSAPPGAFTDELKAAARACKDELAALLRAAAGGPAAWRFVPHRDNGAAEFPLTALQQAYLVGEQDSYDHAAAVYLHEYACAAAKASDPDRLDAALRLLRRTHAALRLAVFTDGTQRVVAADDAPLLDRHDLTGLGVAATERRLEELSASLMSDLPAHEAGQPFLVRFVTLPRGRACLQLALRLTAFDGITAQLFFAELARCYADPGYHPAASELTFRDYVMGLHARAATPEYATARRYWDQRLVTLPGFPDLPVAPGQENRTVAEPLQRIVKRLDAQQWAGFRARAAQAGVPVGSVLLGYGAYQTGRSFAQRCRELQGRLYADLAAREVPGVEVGWTLCSG